MRRGSNIKNIRTYIILAITVALAVGAIILAINIYDYCRGGNCVPTGNYFQTMGKPSAKDPEAEQAKQDKAAVEALGRLTVPDYVNVDYIDPSRARTEDKLTAIRNIVIHYTGNPGTTAQQNRSYFGQPDTTVCSHFLVGLQGEIIQCIPLDEQSAASNHRNVDTISVEVCHPNATGIFNDATYESLVRLTAWLCDNTGLTADDLIRHYDITGKACPKSFVDAPEEWERFKKDVDQKMS